MDIKKSITQALIKFGFDESKIDNIEYATVNVGELAVWVNSNRIGTYNLEENILYLTCCVSI